MQVRYCLLKEPIGILLIGESAALWYTGGAHIIEDHGSLEADILPAND